MLGLRRKSVWSAVGLSVIVHIAFIAFVLQVGRWTERTAASRSPVPARAGSPIAAPTIVWLIQSGPGGGGGGGGNHMKDPPRRAELPGKDPVAVPVLRAREVQEVAQSEKEAKALERLDVPIIRSYSGLESLVGTIEPLLPPPTESQGPGSDGGAGSGRDRGVGPGDGAGSGPGHDGGIGDGPFRSGNGVTVPIPLHKGIPRYTVEAMAARLQASVVLECIVQTTGACSDLRIVRSPQPAWGLDREAIESAREWRFRPGTRLGKAVPVLVTIEVAFTIR
jgi:periplasmic protein TonB